MNLKIALLSLFFSFFFLSKSLARTERVLSLDIGSLKTKYLIVEYDTKAGSIKRYVQGGAVIIPFQQHRMKWEGNHYFKQREITPIFQSKMREVLSTTSPFGPFDNDNIHIVATEVFRTTANAQVYVNLIQNQFGGTKVQIIDQDLEGKLGFYQTQAITNEEFDNIVAWDNGGGSVQISWGTPDKTIETLKFQLGKEIIKNLFCQEFRENDPSCYQGSPNPISKEEGEKAISLFKKHLSKVEIPMSLKNKLKRKETKLFGIGAIHGANIGHSLSLSEYSSADLKSLLENNRYGMIDEDFKNLSYPAAAPCWTLDLLFIEAVLQYLDYDQNVHIVSKRIDNVEILGNTAGIIHYFQSKMTN